jgi:hypothetical protein
MNFVIIGTDHRMQHTEAGFAALLRGWLGQRYFEPLEAIAEEYPNSLGPSLGQVLAQERGLRWYNLDMTTEEKANAGILEEQLTRPMFADFLSYRVPSDEIREQAWIRRLLSFGSQTTLVICGYLHFASLVNRLRAQGHGVDARVYLETVPEIRLLQNS